MSGPRAFRNSQLALRRECPFAYKRTYIDGDPGVPSPALLRGSNVHMVIAATVRALIVDGYVDVYRIAHEVVRGTILDYAEALELAFRVQEAIGVEFDIDPAAVLYVEERMQIAVTLRDGTIVIFYGTPDLAEREGPRTLKITDWKTHWRPESEHAFRADPQLDRYALIMAEKFPGFERFRLVKRFIRYRDNFRERVITADDLHFVRERLVSEIEETIEFESRGDFTPTPGSWCTFCRHHASCPVIQRYRAQGLDDLTIADDERAAQLAGEALALRAYADTIQDRLKAYLGGEHPTGVVPVSGGTYGFGPVEHRAVPAPQLRQTLEEHRVEAPEDLFKTDLDRLDRLAHRLPGDATNAIENITKRWASSQCRFRRATADEPKPATAAGEPQELFS